MRWLYQLIVITVLVATVVIATVALSTRLVAESRNPSSYFVEQPLYFHPASKKYFVWVQIENKSGWMLLDTGASMTLLDEAQFDHSSSERALPTARVFLPFFNTHVTVKKIQIRRLIIGSWKASPLTVGLANSSAIGIPKNVQGHPVLGILGYDVLSLWPFVWISRDRLICTDQYPAISTRAQMTFPLVEQARYLCIREIGEDRLKQRLWIVDTGAESHHVEDPNPSISSGRGSQIALFTTVQLRALGDQNLWLPAVTTARGSPPLVKLNSSIVGIIGNGILSRYEILINHRDKQVSFVESFSPVQRGTFGLLLFSESRQGKMFVYFAAPSGAFGRHNSLVELVAVNEKRIRGTESAMEELLQRPSIGTSVQLTVRDQQQQEHIINCIAFAPEEIDADFFRGTLRVGDSKYSFTALKYRRGNIWLYPFQWMWEDRDQVLQVLPRPSLATPQSSMAMHALEVKPSQEAKSGYRLEMHIRPLY